MTIIVDQGTGTQAVIVEQIAGKDGINATLGSVIYRPGGVSSGNVMATWPEVQAAITNALGCISVFVDDSIVSPALVPGSSGVTECYGRVEFRDHEPDSVSFTVLQIEPGATLNNVYLIESIEIRCRSTTATPSMAWPGGTHGGELILHNFARLSNAATATTSSIVLAAGRSLLLDCYAECSIQLNAVAVPLFSVPATAELDVSAFGTTISNQWATGGGLVTLRYDSASLAMFPTPGTPPTASGVSGTYQTTFLDFTPLAGEVTGQAAASIVSGPFSTATLQWLANVTSPKWTQVTPAATAAGQSLTIQPQSGGATSGNPGSLVLNIASPNGGSSEAGILLQRNGASQIQFTSLVGLAGTFYAIYPGNVSPTSTNYVLYSAIDGSNVGFNSSSIIGLNIGGNNQITIQSTAIVTTPPMNLGNATLQFQTGVSSPTINQAAAAGAATGMTVQAQSAGGTNDGGSLLLTGGTPAGSNTVYGSTIISSPLNPGMLTFTASNGANTLTAAQSKANILLLAANPTLGFTINYLRRIADTSLLFVRNNTSQTGTIAYLTGGTVNVLSGRSALIISDGSNLQIIMNGT